MILGEEPREIHKKCELCTEKRRDFHRGVENRVEKSEMGTRKGTHHGGMGVRECLSAWSAVGLLDLSHEVGDFGVNLAPLPHEAVNLIVRVHDGRVIPAAELRPNLGQGE